MKRLAFLFLSIFSSVVCAEYKEPYIDPISFDIETKRDEWQKENNKKHQCNVGMNSYRLKECQIDEVFKILDQKYPLRGSQAYMIAKYKNFTDKQAEDEIARLNKLKGKLKLERSNPYGKSLKGELSQRNVEGEISWIYLNLLEHKLYKPKY